MNINRKGFTLIELLAVILILGIIALIAVPVVNDVLNDSRMGAFKTTAMNLASKAEETCQLEGIKGNDITHLYTIVEGKLDKSLAIKGEIPNEGYILINNNCESAYSFYDLKYVVSKNFEEDKPTVNDKETAPVYGLKWQSNISNLDDTYTRTFDADEITSGIKAQAGPDKVINQFDTFDIYKDILPYTDEFGNKFMLIPKFYISKSKKETSDEIIWNYAISKHKLDDTYYLPSNFVDEGINNDEHIELPYVLVGKYEAGSNGKIGNDEMLVSKSGIFPKGGITINTARTLATRYNEIENINGYQQYDIHVHDLITMLFAIEYGTMNSQDIIKGYVDNYSEDDIATKTGGSNSVASSSGSIAKNNSPFKYRGMENIWGNVWSFVEGININQTGEGQQGIYTANNSRYYSSDEITDYYKLLEGYNSLTTSGLVTDSGFDENVPFANLHTKVGGDYEKGVGDYFHQNTKNGYKISIVGGAWGSGEDAGLGNFLMVWTSSTRDPSIGTRLVKIPLRD